MKAGVPAVDGSLRFGIKERPASQFPVVYAAQRWIRVGRNGQFEDASEPCASEIFCAGYDASDRLAFFQTIAMMINANAATRGRYSRLWSSRVAANSPIKA